MGLNYTIEIPDVSDGGVIATAVSVYVNSYTTPGRHFYECMLERDTDVQHNFTMLCIEWFKQLANVSIYDERNLASVGYAKRIWDVEPMERRKLSSRGIKREFVFDSRDDECAAAMFEAYLRLSECNGELIYGLLQIHRTSQQSFSRMCCEWFRCAAELTTRHPYVTLAKRAAKQYHGFPLV